MMVSLKEYKLISDLTIDDVGRINRDELIKHMDALVDLCGLEYVSDMPKQRIWARWYCSIIS